MSKKAYFLFPALYAVCNSFAQAQVITIESEIYEVSCTPDVNGEGASNGLVTLPELKTTDFERTTGFTIGETPFYIDLKSCGDSIANESLVRVYFTATGPNQGSYQTNNNGNPSLQYQYRLAGTSDDGAKGWTYQILPEVGDDQLDVLIVSQSDWVSRRDNYPSVDVQSSSGRLSYRVRYYVENGLYGIYPGTRTARANYVIHYL